jgi:hypothetical protein
MAYCCAGLVVILIADRLYNAGWINVLDAAGAMTLGLALIRPEAL